MEEKKKRKETGDYVFPNFLASVMKKVSHRTQYEASMAGVAAILFGISIATIYTVFFTEIGIYFKILGAFNAIAAYLFLSSRLISDFQQYQTYLQTMGLIPEDRDIEAKFKNMLKESSNDQKEVISGFPLPVEIQSNNQKEVKENGKG